MRMSTFWLAVRSGSSHAESELVSSSRISHVLTLRGGILLATFSSSSPPLSQGEGDINILGSAQCLPSYLVCAQLHSQMQRSQACACVLPPWCNTHVQQRVVL